MSTYRKQIKTRLRSAFLISIIVHIIFALVFLFYPKKYPMMVADNSIPVEWVKGVPKPKMKHKEQLKEPIEKKLDPERKIGRDVENMLVRQSQFDINEVIKKSKKPVYQTVEINRSEPAKFVPWIMTDADLPDAEGSNISRMVSAKGPIDGDGEVTGRVRARGHGDGLSLIESYGKGKGSGSGGGGLLSMPEGWDKIADRLGIIDFIREKSGPQQIVYCLDISASMQAAGLKKLELSIDSIKDSLLMLKETDSFNIITFASDVSQMSNSMLPANMNNIEKAFKYLRKFTPQGIMRNEGTDLLGAISLALQFNPSVIALVTDGIPTKGRVKSKKIETDPGKIIKAVQAKNVNRANIYVVGLEITLRESPGASLLIALAEQNEGRAKFIGLEELVGYIQ